MSISYHGVVGYGSGKATLPSVDTWGNNMNILRDPPKSFFTRKIDKVGETSEITQMIQESGDRVCEAINVYARGVDPMVAVSYSNNGNNGGQRSGRSGSAGMVFGGTNSGKQSFLPYRIMQGGAFRPPTKDQRELLPLSRLPRIWTSSFTQPGFADFSKKAMCPGNAEDPIKGVKTENQMLKACIRPTATYQISTPIVEPYEVKYVIKNPVKYQKESGINPQPRFNGELGTPTSQINENILYPDVNINSSGEYVQNAESVFNTEKYTQDVLQGEFNTNKSQNIQTTSIDKLLQTERENYVKDVHTIDYDTPQSGYSKQDYLTTDIDLERVLPYYEAHTNIGQNIHKRMDNQYQERTMVEKPIVFAQTNIGTRDRQSIDNISNRNYRLKPTVNPGEFNSVPTRPRFRDDNPIQEVDIQKSRMRQKIYEMQQDRNVALGNLPFEMDQNERSTFPQRIPQRIVSSHYRDEMAY